MKLEHFAVTVPTRFLAALVAFGLAASLANAGLFVNEGPTGDDFSANSWDINAFGGSGDPGTMTIAPSTRMSLALFDLGLTSIEVTHLGGAFLPIPTTVQYRVQVDLSRLETGGTVTVNYGTLGSYVTTNLSAGTQIWQADTGPVSSPSVISTYTDDGNSGANLLFFGMTRSGGIKAGGITMEIEAVPEPWVGALAAGVLGLVICQDQWRRRRTV